MNNRWSSQNYKSQSLNATEKNNSESPPQNHHLCSVLNSAYARIQNENNNLRWSWAMDKLELNEKRI